MNKELHNRFLEYENIIEKESIKLSKEANKRLLDPDDWPNDYEIETTITIYFDRPDGDVAEFIFDCCDGRGLWGKPGEQIQSKWPGDPNEERDAYYKPDNGIKWYHGICDNRNHQEPGHRISEDGFQCWLYRELTLYLPRDKDDMNIDKIYFYTEDTDISIECIKVENVHFNIKIEYQLLNIDEEE